MVIKSNTELIAAVNAAIAESGVKKGFIAEKLGMSKQTFSQFMTKKNFSIDDANKVLSLLDYDFNGEVKKKY